MIFHFMQLLFIFRTYWGFQWRFGATLTKVSPER